MDKLSFQAIPAAKRLDNIDKQEIELDQALSAKAIDLVTYAHTKHALILKRNKAWASYCRAMGWPIEYHPLTRDPESMFKPVCEPVSADFELYPDRCDIIEQEAPEARKRRRKHYVIFWCWVLVLSGVYLGLG